MTIELGTLSPRATVVLAIAITGVTVGAATFAIGVRRRRLHLRLIKEAVAGLCGHPAGTYTPARRAHRDLARVIAVQAAQAERLEQLVRPRVPDRPGKLHPFTGAPVGHAVAEDIVSALLVLQSADPVLPPVGEPTTAAPWLPGPMRMVPRPDATTTLPEVFGAVRTTVLAQARQVRILLAHATRLGAIEAACRDRLVSALAEVAAADRASGKVAAAGQLAVALRILTEVAIPVPDEGIPGAAARRDLDDQTAELRRVAVGYRAALVDWSREALARCGSAAPVQTEPAGADT